jgi:FSR family fosmidomycin resistance protein-like MFS transporter
MNWRDGLQLHVDHGSQQDSVPRSRVVLYDSVVTATLSPRPHAVLAACWLAFFWALSSRAILSSAMPAVSLETGLDARGVGLVTGVLYAGYATAVYVSGFLPVSRRVAIAGGAVLTAATNVAFARSASLTSMLAIAAVGGAGVGLYLPRGTAAIADAYRPEARARALGWHELAATAGVTAGPLFMGTMLLVAPWRLAVTLWSVVGLAAAVAVWRWVPDRAAPPAGASPGRVRLDARVPALACMGAACFAIISGFFAMLPMIVATGWGATPAAAASFTGWTRASGAVGAVAGGWLADVAGRIPSLVIWYATVLVAVAGLAFLDYGLGFGGLVMVMTVAASGGATAYYALMGDAFRPEERERVFGIIAASASVIGTAAAPAVLGIVLDRFSARAALVTLAGAPLLGLAAVVLYRTAGVKGAA